jgi:RNA polymerase sigma-70 factor (ECF subfamily)
VAPEIERLYRDHRAGLVRLVERELHDRHDAEDAVQTAFLDAQCALERGTIPRYPRAWLATIALNAGRRLRRRRLNAEPLEEYAVPEGSEPAEIRAALASLPREQRTAVVYRDVLGLSYGETAEQMGTSVSAVTMLLHRGRRRLRQTLGLTAAGFGLWRWVRRLGMPQVAVAKSAATVLVAAGLATTGVVAARAVAPPVATEAAAAAAPVAQAHAPANTLAVHSARHHHKAAGRSRVTAAPASTPESGEAATPASVPSPTTAATPSPSPSPSPSTVRVTTAVPVPGLPIPTTPPAVTVSTPVATVTVTIPTVTTATVTTPIVTVTVPIP